MFSKLFQIVVLTAVLNFVSTADVAAASSRDRVRGTLRGTVSLVPTNISTGGVYSVTVTAAGGLSHLGLTKAVWQGDVSIDANLQPTALGSLGWTMTAAQGGTLSGTIQWTASSSTNQPLVYLLTGTLQTTAGTNRLQNVMGQGTITGTINVLTGKATLRVDSTVAGLRKKVRVH